MCRRWRGRSAIAPWPGTADTTRVGAPTIRVIAADNTLRNALVRQIERSGRFAIATVAEPVLDGAGLDDVVITTVSDCPTEDCRIMAARGARVIILTPIPREREGHAYASAGAVAYLPMRVDGADLLETLSNMLSSPGA